MQTFKYEKCEYDIVTDRGNLRIKMREFANAALYSLSSANKFNIKHNFLANLLFIQK